jgi:hypothetical protein
MYYVWSNQPIVRDVCAMYRVPSATSEQVVSDELQ